MGFRIIDRGPGGGVGDDVVTGHGHNASVRIGDVQRVAVGCGHFVSALRPPQCGEQVLHEHPPGAGDQPTAHLSGLTGTLRIP